MSDSTGEVARLRRELLEVARVAVADYGALSIRFREPSQADRTDAVLDGVASLVERIVDRVEEALCAPRGQRPTLAQPQPVALSQYLRDLLYVRGWSVEAACKGKTMPPETMHRLLAEPGFPIQWCHARWLGEVFSMDPETFWTVRQQWMEWMGSTDEFSPKERREESGTPKFGTVWTHDLSPEDMASLLARLERCDGREFDCAIVVWEQCQALVRHVWALAAEVERLQKAEGKRYPFGTECGRA